MWRGLLLICLNSDSLQEELLLNNYMREIWIQVQASGQRKDIGFESFRIF